MVDKHACSSHHQIGGLPEKNQVTGCCKKGSLWPRESKSFWETGKRLCKRILGENCDE